MQWLYLMTLACLCFGDVAAAQNLFPGLWVERSPVGRWVASATEIAGSIAQGQCRLGFEPWRAALLVAQGFVECLPVPDSLVFGMAPELAGNPYGVGLLDAARPGLTPYAVGNLPVFAGDEHWRIYGRASYKLAPRASRETQKKSARTGYSPLLAQAWLDALDSGLSVGLLWRQSDAAYWRFAYSQTIPWTLRVTGALAQTTLLETRQLGLHGRVAFGNWRFGAGLWAVALQVDQVVIEFPLPDLYLGYEF
jgi:hypothetical protein